MEMSKAFTSRWRYTFARTPHSTATDGIGSTAVAVGMVMSEYADWKTGSNIRPGHERLAAVVGVTKVAVKRSIKSLEIAGWIQTEQRGAFGRASVYKLRIPSLVDTVTGEISTSVTGSVGTTLGKRPGGRNGVVSVPLTGSVATTHLYQDLCAGTGLELVAA
jgi:hypothetical protein